MPFGPTLYPEVGNPVKRQDKKAAPRMHRGALASCVCEGSTAEAWVEAGSARDTRAREPRVPGPRARRPAPEPRVPERQVPEPRAPEPQGPAAAGRRRRG